MNVAPSKILLGISLAVYAYVLRGPIFGMSEKLPARASAAPAATAKELSATAVNRNLVLAVKRDPFGLSDGLPTTKPTTAPTTAPTTKPTTAPATQSTTKPTTLPVVKVPVKLEGILYGPAGERAAVINGQAVTVGQTIRTETRGTKIIATEIGADSVVVQSGDQTLRLRMPKLPTDDDIDAKLAQQEAIAKAAPPPKQQKQGTVTAVPMEP